MVKRPKIIKKRAKVTEATNSSALVGNFKANFKFTRTSVIVLAVIAGLVLIGGVVVQHNRSHGVKLSSEADFMNDALQNNDKALALEHAKKALAKTPHDVDAILAVANIDKAISPTEAKQYYKQALNEFKKQDNPDVVGKPAATYWAAAQLADQAGENSVAKQYYQKVVDVINASKSTDSFSQSISAQSTAALKRLQ